MTSPTEDAIKLDKEQKIYRYRPEIDGLRAIAVLFVIINHFNKNILPSGFLGVDMFFVISGYVITMSIAKRQNQGRYRQFVGDFFKRRIQRILPALVACVVVTSLIICMVNPSPSRYLMTGLSSLVGASNIFLIINSTDYFAQSADYNPFLQTWSLGVEEQYYLFYPLILLFAVKNQKISTSGRIFKLALMCLTLLSFAAFVVLNISNNISGYFLMPARFWEISVGCILFISQQKSNKSELFKNKAISTIALCGLVFIVFLPRGYILLSTLAAVILTLILISGSANNRFVNSVLTNKFSIYLGITSYSLYLWHWPVIVIGKWTTGINLLTTPFLILLILLISHLSYKYIEKKYRGKRSSSFRAYVNGALLITISSALIVAMGLNKSALFAGPDSVLKNNKNYHSLVLPSVNNNTLYIFGDSHAGSIGALAEALNYKSNAGIKLHARGFSIEGVDESNKNDFLLKPLSKYSKEIQEGDYLVVVKNFMNYQVNGEFELKAEVEMARFAEAKNAKLILFSPIPFFEGIAPNRHCYKTWFRPFENSNKDCNKIISRDFYERYFEHIITQQRKLKAMHPNTVYIFDAFRELCPRNQEQCSNIKKDGTVLFRDSDHITSEAAISMLPSFEEFLGRVQNE
ncbi:acyltransferase family protein [Synechococcus sp. Minos11]|uniref:acyltransferase family protein n=1 Tax=Synechococcus sp. Minos11 TaxID=221341 RepID=UPI001647BFA9|nr:acyltransferase family protein [Synechococcus sp. Minos11]